MLWEEMREKDNLAVKMQKTAQFINLSKCTKPACAAGFREFSFYLFDKMVVGTGFEPVYSQEARFTVWCH